MEQWTAAVNKGRLEVKLPPDQQIQTKLRTWETQTNCSLPKKKQKNSIPLAKEDPDKSILWYCKCENWELSHKDITAVVDTNDPINQHIHNILNITNFLPCVAPAQPQELPLKTTNDLNIAKPNAHYSICQQTYHLLIFSGLLCIPQAVPLPKISSRVSPTSIPTSVCLVGITTWHAICMLTPSQTFLLNLTCKLYIHTPPFAAQRCGSHIPESPTFYKSVRANRERNSWTTGKMKENTCS